MRPPTATEAASDETAFRPDAVLEFVGVIPADLPVLAARVATFIDGTRPVARVRTRAGASAAGLRDALEALRARGLLRVVGIVEPAHGPQADEAARQLAERGADGDHTFTRGPNGDVIPPHVMAEIQAMIDDESRRAELDGWDAITEEVRRDDGSEG